MAISLDDVQKNKPQGGPDPKAARSLGPLEEGPFEKEKTLRPWENFDHTETKTRTLRAQEAVRKAQAIVRRNELFTMEIPKFVTSKALERELEDQAKEKELEHRSVPVEHYGGAPVNGLSRLLKALWKTIAGKKSG